MITDTPVDIPGRKAAHLVGYVQNVTAEDLEEHKEKDTAGQRHRQSGMEGLFEKELKEQNGCIISIVTSQEKKSRFGSHSQN